MNATDMLTDWPQRQPLGDADWLSPYLAECDSLWQREALPQKTVVLIVAGADYAGNLVLSQLRSKQALSTVLTDSKVTVAYADRSVVRESIHFVYDSLSLEFTPPEIDRVTTTMHPLLVFADTEVFLLDGAQNCPVFL